MNFLEDVTDQVNLRWAWEKVRRASKPGDAWIDEIELAGFEINLEYNLQSVAKELHKGRYRLQPIRPMTYPKNPSKDGNQQVRQYFNVSVRDQVAWTAVVNVVGPYVDSVMPPWSYGNRLFRSIWVEEEAGVRNRKIGKYRHSAGKIYLPFGQSWPIFRRHVFLTTAAMTAKTDIVRIDHFTEEDSEELELQKKLESEYRCPFVLKEYWSKNKSENGAKTLFWCSVDFAKFYPSIKLDIVRKNIVDHLPSHYQGQADVLLDSMLRFKIDSTGWEEEELNLINLRLKQRSFKGIPTGLFVAGFLANAALLSVDLEVVKRLEKKRVAHFRFVDDHIFLANNFDDLIAWVDEYRTLLDVSGIGAKVNPKKIEPEDLAVLFSTGKRKKLTNQNIAKIAKACKLNPQFPTPLMTKTLALVSAIARTDFDLLEESELVALTDQLEHMLLVDIPEDEIPEKTRLSFAATRLIRLTECRLSNDNRSTELRCQLQILENKLTEKGLSTEEKGRCVLAIEENKKLLNVQLERLDRESWRAFGLLRKVLQERPDRVRLWTRAVHMCRQIGVKGLNDILDDIDRDSKEHVGELAAILAQEYIIANTLALLGSEAITAARLICSSDVAEWRKDATRSFLSDLFNLKIHKPTNSIRKWFLQTSWEQYCFGLYCAEMILRSEPFEEHRIHLILPNDLSSVAEDLLGYNSIRSINWTWWAARVSLQDLTSHAQKWVIEIGRRLIPIPESDAIWRFFPLDIPPIVLQRMRDNPLHPRQKSQNTGWWYDAITARPESLPLSASSRINRDTVRVLKNIKYNRNNQFISLHEWVKEVLIISKSNVADPRTSEWTSLEIVRQIGLLLLGRSELSWEYILKAREGHDSPICLHPANFRVPRIWMEAKSMTWGAWFDLVRSNQPHTRIISVPPQFRIADARYTPILGPEYTLFESVNQIRGLGLLLYGLLRRDFELPCIWNGSGHTDVLRMLPKLLLQEMTYSSWTLGVMQSCLQSRSMENLFFLAKPSLAMQLNNDIQYDPISLNSPKQVCDVIEKCQLELKKNQLSTLNQKARQLTPISIEQLSRPDWARDYSNTSEGDVFDEQ